MTNKKVENLIIGFGKAGKTLANVLGNKSTNKKSSLNLKNQ